MIFINIRLYNAKILTMADGAELINGEIWVQNGEITSVGTPDGKRPSFEREINCNQNLLMPGFKNAHTHSAMTFLRSFADDLPLLDWLSHKVFPMEAKLKAQHIAPLVRLAIMEYLSSGITACFDMYMFPDEMAQAAVQTGFRTVLCGCFSNFINTLEGLEEQHHRFNNMHPLVSHILGVHAEYTTDKDKLEGLARLREKTHSPVCTHCSESERETLECIQRTGKTPTAYMAGLGLFDNGGVFYHGVHLSSDDIKICLEKGIAVVTNPGSNTKLASGIAPLTKLKDAGITLAIGTDGAASNNCLDFFREMFLACGLAKLRENDASAMPAFEVLKMATVGGAKVMGLNLCDTLSVGKKADLIMLNLKRPNMQPLNNIINNLVYSGSKENVALTMINGKILYENGQFFIDTPEQELYEQVNEIVAELTLK